MRSTARAASAMAVVLFVTACGSAAPSSPAAAAPARTAKLSASASPSVTPTSAPTLTPASSFEPLTGTFVFHRFDLDNRAGLWTSCADLSGLRQLSRGDGYSAGWSSWAPGGSRIAFNANYADPAPVVVDETVTWDIYTMDRDGGDVRQLTKATGLLGDPDYSPDGRLIAYASDEGDDAGIWVMDAEDGAHPRLVTRLPDDAKVDWAPRFSPDGTRLVFNRDVSDTESAMWIVNLDGSGLRRLTPPELLPGKPDWSPDGTRIAFEAEPGDGELAHVWTIAPDGTGLVDVTPEPTTAGFTDGWSDPVWSPDGEWILVVHGLHPGPTRIGLAVMRPDGTDLRWLANDPPTFDKDPDWTAAAC